MLQTFERTAISTQDIRGHMDHLLRQVNVSQSLAQHTEQAIKAHAASVVDVVGRLKQIKVE